MNNQSSRIVGGLVLVGLGVVFLLVQMDVFALSGNWWAIFIAVPAAALLYQAYSEYQATGMMTSAVRNNFSGGVIVATVAVIAAIGQWGTLWPLFLIVPGVLMLFGMITTDKQKGMPRDNMID